MVTVFASFIFSDDPTIKQFGFALAVGVLIDAFLVRMTLVPAVMRLLGRSAWWLPHWFDRLVPGRPRRTRGLRSGGSAPAWPASTRSTAFRRAAQLRPG
jgi:putative drug exporter of the RND superfamily